jgi:hypothetical protein
MIAVVVLSLSCTEFLAADSVVKAKPFAFNSVRLLDSPFKKAMQAVRAVDPQYSGSGDAPSDGGGGSAGQGKPTPFLAKNKTSRK